MKTLVASLVAAIALSGAGPALAAPKPIAEIKLVPYRKTVALDAVVNGKAGHFIFDSAGGSTVLSPNFAAAAGCKVWARSSGHRMMGDRLDAPRCDNVKGQFGAFTGVAPVGLVLDITALIAKDAAPVDGSIALDMFDGQAITIDVSAGKLIVESPASLKARIRTARELPVRLARETQGTSLAANLEVQTAQGVARFELDTGNGGTILVAAPFAELFGLKPNLETPQNASFEVAPGIRAEGLAFAPDKMILDGNLGMPFLRKYAVTLDLKASRLWLAPTGS
jgi:hypothetical protein